MTEEKNLTFEVWQDRLNAPEPIYLFEWPMDYRELPGNPLSVIKFNSTFLELADISYGLRGVHTLICLGFALSFLATAAAGAACPVAMYLSDRSLLGFDILFCGFAVVMAAVFGALGFTIWRLGVWSSFFKLTHVPVRFNRRNRRVYFMRDDGRTLSASWDRGVVVVPASRGLKIYVLDEEDGAGNRPYYERAILGEFSVGAVNKYSDVFGLWELLRRYMDEDDGPALAQRVGPVCLPIAEKREPWVWSWHWVGYEYRWPVLKSLLFWFTIPAALLRVLALATCRRPVWPPEVEAECRIEPGDPLVRDEGGNPPLSWLRPPVDPASLAFKSEAERDRLAEEAGFPRRFPKAEPGSASGDDGDKSGWAPWGDDDDGDFDF